jgi:hypothetical protein
MQQIIEGEKYKFEFAGTEYVGTLTKITVAHQGLPIFYFKVDNNPTTYIIERMNIIF